MDKKPKQKETDHKKSVFPGFQLLLVQSTVCLAAVLLFLLLRFLGVDVYADLASRFHDAMTQDVLVSAYGTSETTALPTVPTSATVAVSASVPGPTFVAPLQGGTLTSPFGERSDPFGTEETCVHEGMDIAAAQGTPLRALTDGTVKTVSYEENGYGHYVTVACVNGYRYLYAHCASVDVRVGDTVEAGQPIATVGNSGQSTGPHVHVEWIRDDGVRCDPAAVIPRDAYV